MSRSELLTFTANLRLPAIAAPMFLVSGVELVLAACRAGVVGAFPAPNARSLDDLEAWCERIRRAHASEYAPWALNVVAHRTYPRLAAETEMIAAFRPPLVISALGSPRHVVDTVHAYGGLLFADVSTVEHAVKATTAGVDGLVLVCAGAGGHTGTYNPFAFVHEVRTFFEGPVVVAGGVCDGRAIAAVRALGADLAYIGTRFIATRESLAANAYREMVADSGLSDIVLSDEVTGVPANWLSRSLRAADAALRREAHVDFSGITGESRRRWKDIWAAGHGVAGASGITSVAELVEELVGEYERARGASLDHQGAMG